MLKEGKKAPNILGENQEGKQLSLNDFKGKKVILYFYPKDNTPGCTAQACSLKDNYKKLKKEGFEVVGVSADTKKKHQNFINKFDLPFDLVADVDKKLIESFGVWGPKKFMGREFDGILRTTFIIDENGKIEKVIDKVTTKSHAQQILEMYNN